MSERSLTHQKYKILSDDVSPMGRYIWNMLHWNENDIKSSQTTNGDYCICNNCSTKYVIEIKLLAKKYVKKFHIL